MALLLGTLHAWQLVLYICDILCHDGSIIIYGSCTITSGSQRYSSDLPQGELELPCTYAFVSDNQHLLQKERRRLEEEGTRVANNYM